MNEQIHITHDQLVSLCADEMRAADAASLNQHIADCAECRAKLDATRGFTRELDAAWNSARLESLGLAHPTVVELEQYWFGEADEATAASIREHVATCDVCTQHLDRLSEGLEHLKTIDPLSEPLWSDTVGRTFAAGIEMIVEAAHGAYTTVTGLVRDAMTPQATMKLTAAPAKAKGRDTVRPEHPALWHNAAFVTDEVSGEVSGSSDNSTGRGIITVIIHKSGEYVAYAPIVDLVTAVGNVVATQSGLDMGDHYSATFANLDEGRYLVGIRERRE